MKCKIEKQLLYMHIVIYVCIFIFVPPVVLGETIDDLKVKAQAGDGEAQHNLAFAYYLGEDYSGKSVEQNNTKAFELWLQAAQNGYVYSQVQLAYLYQEGFVVQKNLEKADFWNSKAFNQNLIKAKNGEVEFQYNLAKNYLYGQGVKKDSKEALYWFQSAAEKGNIEAQAMLGSLYSINSSFLGQFEKFWVLNFGIAAKAHFKKSAILLWRIHRIEWLK